MKYKGIIHEEHLVLFLSPTQIKTNNSKPKEAIQRAAVYRVQVCWIDAQLAIILVGPLQRVGLRSEVTGLSR